MPKFLCRCGNVLNLSEIWPECEWRLVPMKRIAEIAEGLEKSKIPDEEGFYNIIDEVSFVVYKCQECDNIYLEVERNKFDTYSKNIY